MTLITSFENFKKFTKFVFNFLGFFGDPSVCKGSSPSFASDIR